MSLTTSFTIIDAQDGLRIVFFTRRGRIFAWKLTERGRFLRRVFFIEISITRTLSYEGSRDNPIYFDVKTSRVVSVEQFYEQRQELERDLELTNEIRTRLAFGTYLLDLAEISGIEYKEVPRESNKYFQSLLVWTHHEGVRPKEQIVHEAV